MTNMTGSQLSICSHPGKITGYWITTRSFPYRGPGQYGCLFARCRKYVINSLGPIWGSRDDNQANMEMPMYKSVNIYFGNLQFPSNISII
jgi:hypothetical protein